MSHRKIGNTSSRTSYVSQEDKKHFAKDVIIYDVSQADRKHFVKDVICLIGRLETFSGTSSVTQADRKHFIKDDLCLTGR